MTQRGPLTYFKTGGAIICTASMLYVRVPSSLRNVEDLLNKRDIGVTHEAVQYWRH
jgi:putative transposase